MVTRSNHLFTPPAKRSMSPKPCSHPKKKRHHFASRPDLSVSRSREAFFETSRNFLSPSGRNANSARSTFGEGFELPPEKNNNDNGALFEFSMTRSGSDEIHSSHLHHLDTPRAMQHVSLPETSTEMGCRPILMFAFPSHFMNDLQPQYCNCRSNHKKSIPFFAIALPPNKQNNYFN